MNWMWVSEKAKSDIILKILACAAEEKCFRQPGWKRLWIKQLLGKIRSSVLEILIFRLSIRLPSRRSYWLVISPD